MAKMSVAQAVVEILRQQQVTFVAGIPGSGVMDYMDALYHQSDVRFILVRHEQVAAHMALGYAEACGRPAVTLVSRSPGACNTVIGVASAFIEGSPLVAISAHVNSHARGLGAFQEIDLEGLFKPITKWSVTATQADRVPEILQEAFRVATSGRPGPVHVAVPLDFPTVQIDFDPNTTRAVAAPARLRADEATVQRAADLLLNGERPVIVAGGGVTKSDAAGEVLELAERLTAAVANSWNKKALPEDHPLVIGQIGSGGSSATAVTLADADVILAVGLRFSEFATDLYRMKFRDDQKLIQIDVDPGTVGRVLPVELGIVADARAALEQILQIVREARPEPYSQADRLKAITGLWDEWQRELDAVNYNAKPISSPRLMRDLREVTDRDALISMDSGNFGFWVGRYFTSTTPGSLLYPAGGGPMGCGLPGAMGAKLAFPDRQVVCVAGDGGFIMTMQDLETAAREGINVTSVIMNNMALGNIKIRQQYRYGGRYIGCEYGNPDFARAADLFGCIGERVEDPDEIKPALRRALAADRPAVVDVLVDPNEICKATVEQWWGQRQTSTLGMR